VAVGGQVDAKSRLVPVRIARDDGQAVAPTTRICGPRSPVGQEHGWKVPAFGRADGRPKVDYVFQVGDGKAVRANVRVLIDAGEVMLIDGKLQPDRKLVTDGAYQLSERDGGA